MGYNIEISFNLLKNSNVCNLQEMVKNKAYEYGCISCYEDYEYNSSSKMIRNHCIITCNFDITNMNLSKFINLIKNKKELYLESIYDDEKNILVYASKYYSTQQMNEKNVKDVKDCKMI